MRNLRTLFILAAALLALPSVAHAQSSYRVVEQTGTAITRRQILNFTGAGISCADNAGTKATDCTASGAPAGSAGGALAGTYPNPTIAASATITTPVVAGGLTASGAGANDFSGSTGTFKTPTGAVTIGPGVVSITGSMQLPAGAQTVTPYTLAATDYYQAITTGASNFVVNLPACVAGTVGRKYVVKKLDSGAGAIQLTPNGTDTIEGTNAAAQFAGATSSAGTDTKGQFSYVEVLCRAAGAWDVVGQRIMYGATLTSGTPSTWTVTVPTGSQCVCSNGTTQANPVKCAVSGTTLTATGPNTVTDSVNASCSF